MLSETNARILSVPEAAARLGVSVEQMLAWNMVVIHDIDGFDVVPSWSADPLVARYIPTLSQVFQGEALSYCLARIRPMSDSRDGLGALRDGHWREVLAALQGLRAKLDRALCETRPLEIAGFTDLHRTVEAITLH